MNPTWEHDPDMLLFGLVDLSGVVPVDSEDLDLPFPPRTAETPTKLKRERPSDPRAEEDAEGEGRLSSNKSGIFFLLSFIHAAYEGSETWALASP